MLKNNNIKKLSFFLILLLQDQFFLLRGVYLDECSRLIALDDSESLAYLSRERVEIIDTKTLETRHQLDQSVHGMVALDRERFITTSPNDCGIYLWSGSSHALVGELLGHDRPISAIVVDRDAKLLLSGDTSGTIYLWDLSSHTCIQTLKTPEVIYDFLFIDDQTIAVASYNEIYIFNLLIGFFKF